MSSVFYCLNWQQLMTDSSIWSVYFVRTASNALYCGVSTDVARRFQEHQQGKKGAKALRGKGPLSLVWHYEVGDKCRAMQMEYRIKQLTKTQKEAIAAQRVDPESVFHRG